MKSWILAARPKTLPAAIVPVWVGAAIPLTSGSGSWGLFFCTLISCVFIQIATNLFNDAIDSQKGADTEKRLGPTRVTASGALSAHSVLLGALLFCFLAAMVAVPMILARGWPIVVIGLISLFFSYGYTGGPVPLAYRGLGELFVIIFFGFVSVMGSFYVQVGGLGGDSIPFILGLSLACGFYSSALIAINNLRDVEEDSSTGKRTLAVRWGKGFARGEITLFCFGPLLLSGFWLSRSGREGFAAVWAFLFLQAIIAVFLVIRVFSTPPSPAYNKYLALAALQLVLFAVVVGTYAYGL